MNSNRPAFVDGAWHYPEPTFETIPPPNERVVILSWPDEYEFGKEGITSISRIFILHTPTHISPDWFKAKVTNLLGNNYRGWIYAC